MPSPAVNKPTYGVCSSSGITLKFGQVPGYPSAAMGTVVAPSLMDQTELTFTLLEFGKDASDSCLNGDEFNPLEEKYNGVPVMY